MSTLNVVTPGIDPTKSVNPSTAGRPRSMLVVWNRPSTIKRPWWSYLRLSVTGLMVLVLAVGGRLGLPLRSG